MHQLYIKFTDIKAGHIFTVQINHVPMRYPPCAGHGKKLVISSPGEGAFPHQAVIGAVKVVAEHMGKV